jgi:hypothetical protein
MVSIVGIHPDGWLEGSSIIDFPCEGDLELVVYIPEIEGQEPTKAVTLLIGADIVSAEVVRGRVTTLGPFTTPRGPFRVCLDVATLEPITETDKRSLGLKLVRIVLQGEELNLTETSAVNLAPRLYGKWPISADVSQTANGMVETS